MILGNVIGLKMQGGTQLASSPCIFNKTDDIEFTDRREGIDPIIRGNVSAVPGLDLPGKLFSDFVHIVR